MSDSNEINDKNQKSIVPDQIRSTQVSEIEKQRLQAGWLKDASDRAACLAHIDFAEKQSELADERYRCAEEAYVKKHLQPENTFDPTSKWTSQSLEVRRFEIIQQYRSSEEGQEAVRTMETRQEQVWQRATDALDAAQQRDPNRPNHTPKKDRGKSNVIYLSRAFNHTHKR